MLVFVLNDQRTYAFFDAAAKDYLHYLKHNEPGQFHGWFVAGLGYAKNPEHWVWKLDLNSL